MKLVWFISEGISNGRMTCLLRTNTSVLNKECELFMKSFSCQFFARAIKNNINVTFKRGFAFIFASFNFHTEIWARHITIFENEATYFHGFGSDDGNFFNYDPMSGIINYVEIAAKGSRGSFDDKVWFGFTNCIGCLFALFTNLFEQDEEGDACCCCACPAAKCAYPVTQAHASSFIIPANSRTYNCKIKKPKGYKGSHSSSTDDSYKNTFFAAKHFHAPANDTGLSSTITNGLARAAA